MKLIATAADGLLEEARGTTPTKVADANKAPYHFTGRLDMTFPNGNKFLATAILIGKKEGQEESQYILTCAHNLYDKGEGGEATRVAFSPAMHNNSKPHGTIEHAALNYPAEFKRAAISHSVDTSLLGDELVALANQHDYAIVKLKSTVKVDDIPVAVVQADGELKNLALMMHAYGSLDTSMTEANGKVTKVAATELEYDIKAVVGDSGAGLMPNNKSVVAIQATKSPTHCTGVRITQAVKNNLDSWMS